MTNPRRLLWLAALALPGVALAANCESLAALALTNTTITFAKPAAAGSFIAPGGQTIPDLPAFCEIHGVIKPTEASSIHFEVWLPASGWNGKFQTVGNGGLAGTISLGPMGTALRNGYATASTDTGHTAQEPKEWLENRERLIDYSYRALHLTTINAKALIFAYYAKAAQASYFLGCSTGGKQGLMEAQRYPADYDGIVAGDAANFWTHQMMNEIWDGVATGTPETSLPQEKLQLLQDATLAACDALDGATDGIIGDPTRCHFDPTKLQCKTGDGPNCLTRAQVDAVEKMYRGPMNPRTGKKIYPGMYPGGELGWGKAGGQMVINRTTTSGVSSYDFWGYAFFHKPDWDFRTFDFDRDTSAADEKLGPITNATDSDLEPFRKLGHKLIYYHGAADPVVPAQNGIDYFETVVKAQNGLEKTQQFFRVFLVPGMYHCSGGPGATAFGGATPSPVVDAEHDLTSAVDRWVEKGVAPEKIIATRFVDNRAAKGVALERPLCSYPMVARYKGSGDPDKAANFACSK